MLQVWCATFRDSTEFGSSMLRGIQRQYTVCFESSNPETPKKQKQNENQGLNQTVDFENRSYSSRKFL